MHPFAQVILDGLFTGSTYALMAAGLALILGVVKVVNLSHGAFFSLGAYVAYVLSGKGVSNPAAAVLLACVIAFAFGVFLGKSFINPVRSHPFSVAVGSLGFAILFEQAAQMLWGPHPVSIGSGPPWGELSGVVVRRWGAVSLLASAGILGGLALFLSSRWGLPLKLISEEEEIAGSVGIDVEKIRYLTFGFASATAAAAGALLAPATSITPTMGRVPLILSLIVVIASGMENVLAIFLLAVGLGLLSNIGAYLLAPQWSYVSLLTVISLLLLLRPGGLSAADPGRDY
ncbi:MAG: branched-chain amino acid ABC transporter permease [Deltaproteobacteria bacterium]|jgi:branched-chain amino acid transport system permease protein|nr:MAG: branched-chain amino acid ABC transporter permease [Deltaproteobacteria bacterium]